MKKLFGLLFIVFAMISLPLVAQDNQDNEAVIARTVDYLKEVKQQWQIPGIAFAVVKDGEMIYSDGFGVKEQGKDDPVDANTLFQIGSVSKSFTAAVMASLVAEDRLSWEDTVKNILPDFRMYDRWVEENLQVKDIMTHHSGLQGQLGTYIPNMGYEREDIWNMLPLLKPKYSLRGSYEYNNITFIIASRIIEKLTGKSWEENVRERVFEPVGMKSSYVTGEEFAAAANVATPHSFGYRKGAALTDSTWKDSVAVEPLHGEEQALHWLSVIGPAGSISSTAEDMAKYLLFHLNKGKVNGKQVIESKQMEYLRKGHTITSQDSARVTMYGHCWFVEQNSRYRLYFHTGTTWGFTTLAAFMPEQDLGFVILVNSEAPAYPRYAIMRRLIDLYKGFPDKDYSKDYYESWLENSRESVAEREEKRAEREEKTAPDYSLVVGEYYKDKLFGGAVVEQEGEDLYITIGPKDWKSILKHVNGNIFSFRMDGHSFDVEFVFAEAKDVGNGSDDGPVAGNVAGETDPDKGNLKCIGLDVDFNYTENFGLWPKID
jgi:CubicO group peptidase (beta-lactamase class C family)